MRVERGLRTTIVFLAGLALTLPFIGSATQVFYISFVQMQAITVIAFLMGACALVLAAGSPSYRLSYKDPVVQGLLVLLAGNVALVPFATDPGLAFWSTPIRITGVFFLLVFGVFVLSIVVARPSQRMWRALLAWNTFVAATLAGSGVVIWFLEPADRIGLTLQNPITVGAYMVMSFFLAGYLFLSAKNRLERGLLAVALGLMILALVFTVSRGPLLALFVGLLTSAFIWMKAKKERWAQFSKWVWVVGLGIAFMVGVYLFFHLTPTGELWREKLPFFLERLLRARSMNRFLVWDVAVRAWLDAPLIGWGYEWFGTLFQQYVDYQGAHIALTENYFDRPHNEFVYILVSTGVIGVGLWAYFWAQVVRAVREQKNTALRIAAGGFVAAYLVNALWIYILIPVFVLLGVLLARLAQQSEPNKQSNWSFKPVVAVLAAVIVVPLLWWSVWRPTQIALAVERGVAVGLEGSKSSWREAQEILEPALNTPSFMNRTWRLRLYDFFGDRTRSNPDAQAFETFLWTQLRRTPFEQMTFYEQLATADLALRVGTEEEVLKEYAQILKTSYPHSVDEELTRLIRAIDQVVLPPRQ